MRPTRWTKQHPRVTYYGKGGWRVGRHGFMYTHPVTGNGVSAGWNLRAALALRRKHETKMEREELNRPYQDALTDLYDTDRDLFWHLAGEENRAAREEWFRQRGVQIP